MMRPSQDDRRVARRLAASSRANPGAIERFWRLVIASALNADLDAIAVPYAAKVIRELFMNSAQRGQHGHEHGSPQRALCGGAAISRRAAVHVHLNTNVEVC